MSVLGFTTRLEFRWKDNPPYHCVHSNQKIPTGETNEIYASGKQRLLPATDKWLDTVSHLFSDLPSFLSTQLVTNVCDEHICCTPIPKCTLSTLR